jgi:crotonobetainyl-CoA:carnitine CoA-transferase CaiB-like acyl-CoA transferase
MASLTGRADGPGSGGPVMLIEAVAAWSEELAVRSAALGSPVVVDPLGLLAERAAVGGLVWGGRVSCGGGCRLLPCADGWVAASVSRASDWELVAAWLGRRAPVAPGGWAEVAEGVAPLRSGEVRARAELMGLPVAVLGERRRHDGRIVGAAARSTGRTDPTHGIHGIRGRRIRPAHAVDTCADLMVADLSSLWAGPLVARLLGRAGARVVKVESTGRPDGARYGSPLFYGRLNGGKESVALDFTSPSGRHRLAAVVAAADVVITGSRPRALEQLGLDIGSLVRNGRPRVWLSITGYGADRASGQRVAFGDDAAVAGGLVASDEHGPYFCGDAIADPLSGLASTVAVLAALMSDGAWVIDTSMADVAGGLAGPPVPMVGRAAPPPARPGRDPVVGPVPPAAARDLGADTETVLAELRGG